CEMGDQLDLPRACPQRAGGKDSGGTVPRGSMALYDSPGRLHTPAARAWPLRRLLACAVRSMTGVGQGAAVPSSRTSGCTRPEESCRLRKIPLDSSPI